MNQHFVPRAYLKNFACKKGKQYFVDIYDKDEARYFNTNIKNVCSEADLYTLQEGNALTKDLLVVEKIYANGIEPLFVKAYDILTNNDIFWMTRLQRIEMLLAIFQFYVRNPKMLKRAIRFHKSEILKRYKQSKENGSKGVTYQGEDFSFRDFSEMQVVEFFEQKLTNEFKENHVGGIGELGNFHENAIFEINVIRDDSEFITSDHPLVVEDMVTEDEHPLLKSKRFIIPLNKKIALVLYHDNTKRRDRIYRCFIPNGSVAIINRLILEQFTRFVIANKKILDEHYRICKDVLDNTSLHLKINSMRQIMEKFERTVENGEAHNLIKIYLEKFEKEGNLSDEDQHELICKLKAVQAKFIKNEYPVFKTINDIC